MSEMTEKDSRKRHLEKEEEDEEVEGRVKKKDEEEEDDKELELWLKKKGQDYRDNHERRLREHEEKKHKRMLHLKQRIKTAFEKKEAEEEEREGAEPEKVYWLCVHRKVKRMIEHEEEHEEETAAQIASGLAKAETLQQLYRKIHKIVLEEMEYHSITFPERYNVDYLKMLLPHDGSVQPRCFREMDFKEMDLYCQMVNESKGFDVPKVQGSLIGMISCLHMSKTDENHVEDLATQALEAYNKDNRKIGRSRFVLDRLVKANSQPVSGLIYYITFKAVNFSNTCGMFRAKVWDKISGPPEIMFCEMTSATDCIDNSLAGRRIKVWRPMDKMFYEGVVDSYDPVKGEHKMVYADGDVENLNLKEQRWEMISADVSSKEEQGLPLAEPSNSF